MGGRQERARTRRAALAGLLAAAAIAPAAAGGATSAAEVTVIAGTLSLATSDFQGQSAVLTGTDQVLQATPGSPWSATDARGTGAPWTVVASATDLVSAGTPDRVIPSSALALTTGAVTAGAGADPAAGIAGAGGVPFTVASGPGQTDVAVVAASGPHRGSYTFTPRLDITIPGSALASYVGAPYTTTLTVTIS